MGAVAYFPFRGALCNGGFGLQQFGLLQYPVGAIPAPCPPAKRKGMGGCEGVALSKSTDNETGGSAEKRDYEPSGDCGGCEGKSEEFQQWASGPGRRVKREGHGNHANRNGGNCLAEPSLCWGWGGALMLHRRNPCSKKELCHACVRGAEVRPSGKARSCKLH